MQRFRGRQAEKLEVPRKRGIIRAMARDRDPTSPQSRLADLHRQGFMKPRRTARAPAPERPMVTCDACQNWHREGKHTADATTRRANLAKLKAQGGRYLPNGIEAMTFGEATQIRDQLDADVSRLSDELNSFPKGPMGITPDSVRATSEWRAASAAYGRAFAALRNFNEQYVKLFRSELAAARRARRGGYAPNGPELELPARTQEVLGYEAHGKTLEVKKLKPGEYFAIVLGEQRGRFGNSEQIREDIQSFLEIGVLPRSKSSPY